MSQQRTVRATSPRSARRATVIPALAVLALIGAALLGRGALAWVEAGLAAGLLLLLGASHAARRYSRQVLLYRPTEGAVRVPQQVPRAS